MSSKPQFVGEKQPLENRVDYVRGVTYKAAVDLHEELNDSSYVLLRANNIQDGELRFDDVQYVDRAKVKQKQLLRRGDILFCASSGSKGLVGKAALVRENMPVTFGAFCCVLRPKENEAEYLAHYFQSQQYRRAIEKACSGSNINNLKAANFFSLVVPHYDDDSTRVISALFDSIDAQIKHAKDQIANLDSLVKSRFVEMFGDPDSNPHGLEVCPLGKVLSVQPSNGMYKPQKDYVSDGSGTPIIRIDSFRNEGPDYSSLKRLNCNESECRRYGINENDIVINRVNSVGCMGKTMLVSHIPEVTVFESNMMRLHSDEALMIPAFLCVQMTSEFSKSYFEANAKRAIGQASINQKDVKGLPVLVPTIGNQKKYLSFVAEVGQSRFVDLPDKGHEFLLGLDISKRKLDRGKLLCVDVRLVDSAFCHAPKERLGGA